MKSNINEVKVQEMTKEELKSFVKDLIKDESSKTKLDEEKIRKIVREMLKKQYRMFWEKSSFFLDRL